MTLRNEGIWGTPNMVKNGADPELLLAGKYGHKIHIWDLDKRRHLQELDLGAEQQMVLGMALPREAIRYLVAALLLGLGIYSMLRHHHPRWVRMQVSFGDLTLWSFLIATAHGAGLMVLPVLLGSSTSKRRAEWPATLTCPPPVARRQPCSPLRSTQPPILRSLGLLPG